MKLSRRKKIMIASITSLLLITPILLIIFNIQTPNADNQEVKTHEVEEEKITFDEMSSIGEHVEEVLKEEKEEIMFYHQELSDELISTLESISPINENVITYPDLRHVIVSHYDFNGEVQRGELIVNNKVADEIIEIFKEVFEVKYPIEKMVLVSEYNNDDDLSMADNNTSAFNFRPITGGGGWSNHAYGLAIDINPKYNPYVSKNAVYPVNAVSYVNRDEDVEGMIKEGDALFNAFTSRGWTWGGDWNSLKDYQHFEKEYIN